MKKILTAPLKAFKQLTQMRFPRFTRWLSWNLPRTRYDYAKEVGDGLGSSVIMAPILWIARTFPEAPVMLEKLNREKEFERIPEHAMLQLLKRPNPFYSQPMLWMATLISIFLDGNGYWIKIRSLSRKIVQLWYTPHWIIDPKYPQDGSEYISHYEYRPDGEKHDLPPSEVVHFRYGIDPRNTRKGLSPLYPMLREVFTDLEASNFSASVLRNMGIPGVIISPKDIPNEYSGVQVDAEGIKEKYIQKTTGDKRGEPLVLNIPVELKQLGWPLKDMDLSGLRNVSEERVCAMLGTPAAVVGFGSGLEMTKVGATMAELVKLAWNNNIIPTQRLLSAELETQLLIDYIDEADLEDYKVGFDTSKVKALQEDMNKLAERNAKLYDSGIITRAQAKEPLGYPVSDEDYIYKRKFNEEDVPAQPKGIVLWQRKSGNGNIRWKQSDEERGHPSPELLQRMIEALDRDKERLQKNFAQRLKGDFDGMGRRLEEVALAYPGLDTADLERTVYHILQQFDPDDYKETVLRKTYEQTYLLVAQTTFESVNTVFGLAVDIPDPVANEILREGGTRLGLIDLTQDTKDALFRTITELREMGAGPVDIARAIREQVPPGPWSTSEIRANVIARTEVKHAQRMSSLKAYESGPFQDVIIFDARLGPTDRMCEERDQQVMSFEEARNLYEHPNGTLDFVGYHLTPQSVESEA